MERIGQRHRRCVCFVQFALTALDVRQRFLVEVAPLAAQGRSVLSLTASCFLLKAGYTDMVRELLAVGADSNVTDMNADTPLFVAVKERHSAAATELIAGGRADVRRRDAARGRQPVHYAAELGLTSVVTALLDAGSDVNTADADGRTALMLATIGGHEDVARLTMDRDGCDVNVVDSTQRTSLFYAAQLGLVDTVRRLLQVRPLSVCNTFCY